MVIDEEMDQKPPPKKPTKKQKTPPQTPHADWPLLQRKNLSSNNLKKRLVENLHSFCVSGKSYHVFEM